jgi:hypothetical protein
MYILPLDANCVVGQVFSSVRAKDCHNRARRFSAETQGVRAKKLSHNDNI